VTAAADKRRTGPDRWRLPRCRWAAWTWAGRWACTVAATVAVAV